MASYSDIQYRATDGIVTIAIDRPAVKNAFTAETIAELADAIHRFRDDDDAYAAILTGTDDSFCAGADVTEIPDWPEMGRDAYAEFLDSVQNVVRGLLGSEKPTIAAVNGPAIGAGCDFALACDLRVVGEDAVLREGFVNIGLISGDGGAWLLPRLIGEAKAKEYLLTGRDILPEEAVDVGLALQVAADPLSVAQDVAGRLLKNPTLAVQRTNSLIDVDESFEEHCKRAIEYQWECVNDPEHEEAMAAFRDGRDPVYDREYS